jgi:hypothetical protein
LRLKTRIVALITLIIACWVSLPAAASFVQQRYRFIALTSNWFRPGGFQYVVWIVEDLSGEANSSAILQVVLREDQAPVLVKTRLREYGDWQWFLESVGKIESERFKVVWEEQGLFTPEDSGLFVLSPERNVDLMEAFRDSIRIGYSGAYDWNDAMGLGGVDPPRVEGSEWDLVYYYPGGLYIDYEITDVYYFPRPRYLLLFTHQDMLATGMDTMHGFIILKLNSDGE